MEAAGTEPACVFRSRQRWCAAFVAGARFSAEFVTLRETAPGVKRPVPSQLLSSSCFSLVERLFSSQAVRERSVSSFSEGPHPSVRAPRGRNLGRRRIGGSGGWRDLLNSTALPGGLGQRRVHRAGACESSSTCWPGLPPRELIRYRGNSTRVHAATSSKAWVDSSADCFRNPEDVIRNLLLLDFTGLTWGSSIRRREPSSRRRRWTRNGRHVSQEARAVECGDMRGEFEVTRDFDAPVGLAGPTTFDILTGKRYPGFATQFPRYRGPAGVPSPGEPSPSVEPTAGSGVADPARELLGLTDGITTSPCFSPTSPTLDPPSSADPARARRDTRPAERPTGARRSSHRAGSWNHRSQPATAPRR